MHIETAYTNDITVQFNDTAAAARGSNPIMARREHFAREYAVMKAYLQQVGIEKFADEQMKMDKIFKALAIVKGEFGQLESHVEAIQQYFDHYLPRNSEEMEGFIAGYVNGAADNNVKLERSLYKMQNRIHQLLSLPDTMLDTLGRRGGHI